MENPVRIIHVLGSTNLGGAESRIMDLYRHMDRNRVQFDFLVHTSQEGYFDKEIRELGGYVFNAPRFRGYNYGSYVKWLENFFAWNHVYRAVQGHMTSTAAIYLPIAKRAGIPIVIAHARSAGVDKGIKGILTRYLRRNLPEKTDYMFTCSELAGISVFGKKAVEEGKTIFMPNAIDSGKFDYNPRVRKKIREELGIRNQYVIGHVGRFHYAKNHEYLLKIFAALCKKEKMFDNFSTLDRRNYMLLLLGEGERMDMVKRQVKDMGIGEKVLFVGNRGNVYDYYQAMDYFVYPSRYEGLPGTVVEAQAAGLRCLISDSICREVEITELVHTMRLGETPESWARYIERSKEYERIGHSEQIKRAGFDVAAQAKKMMEFYETGELR